MSSFEDWWEDYILLVRYEYTTDDLKAAFEAGWNACAYERTDDTYEEYMERHK